MCLASLLTVTFKELKFAFDEEAIRTNRTRLLLAAAVSAAESTISAGYDIPEVAK